MTAAHDPSAPPGHLPGFAREEQGKIGRNKNGLRYRDPDLGGFLEGHPARGGARLQPRLVLRHADAERRLLRRDGGGGRPYQEDPARHRRAGAVEPHRAGDGQCAGEPQPACAGPHRLRRRHRLHGAARDGLRRDQGQGDGDLRASGLWPAAPRDRRVRDGGPDQEDPLPQSRAAGVQHDRSDRAALLGLRAAHAGADREVQGGLDRLRRQGRERRQGSAGDARGLDAGGSPHGRPAGHRLRAGLRAAGRRAGRLEPAPWRRPARARR